MFNNATEFSQHIEETAFREKRTPLEVLVEYVEENDITDDKVRALVSRSLAEKLQKNFESLGLLPKPSNTLTDFFSPTD